MFELTHRWQSGRLSFGPSAGLGLLLSVGAPTAKLGGGGGRGEGAGSAKANVFQGVHFFQVPCLGPPAIGAQPLTPFLGGGVPY